MKLQMTEEVEHHESHESHESYESVSTYSEEEDVRSKKESTCESLLEITREHIQEMQQKLCLIKLCWPEVDRTKDLYLKTLPNSYCNVSDKEKLLAWYAENFRQQFHVKYPNRKPLLLACENECGVQDWSFLPFSFNHNIRIIKDNMLYGNYVIGSKFGSW